LSLLIIFTVFVYSQSQPRILSSPCRHGARVVVVQSPFVFGSVASTQLDRNSDRKFLRNLRFGLPGASAAQADEEAIFTFNSRRRTKTVSPTSRPSLHC
jgi:hypothetical protein